MKTTKRKKILALSYLFPNPEKPNHGIFVFNRLNAMSKYADVTVVNPIPWSPVHKYLSKFKHLENVPFQTKRGNLTIYHPRYLSIPGYLKELEIVTYKRAVKDVVDALESRFDLVDLHWTFPDLPTGDYLSRKYKVPYRVTLRGMEAFHQRDGGVRQRIVAKYLARVDKVISLSEEMAETADKIAKTRSKTAVVRNGVDVETFFYKNQASCRELLGLPQDIKIVLGVGALIYRKGFDVVIKALNLVKSEKGFDNTHFYVLGAEGAEGDFRKQLNKLVSDMGLADRVHFVGAIPNERLVDWYNAADVFCLSSRGEGSPNVLTEALATGCPAVATSVGSVPEIMNSESDLGEMVACEDVQATYSALIRVLTAQRNREKQSQQFSKYSWDWCAKQVV